MAAGIEGLGVFYLGRRYDAAAQRAEEGPLLYDASDLVTHAVCVGMTGSGKTGLCIALLEEALLDGIPALIVDPKGDLANLLLTFPDLRPEDFAPWVNDDDARKAGVSRDEFAAREATRWREGLADWGQDGERIRRLRAAAEFALYTPGSTAGRSLSVLASFAAPPQQLRDDAELFQERIATTAGSLLGWLGVEADPLRREHILLASLFQHAWSRGQDLDLPALIQLVQTPPLKKIGVLDLDVFFPAADRFALAMRLNNLLAAPGFASWLEGAPLDIDRLLYGADGRPRAAIVSIAHLTDAERMLVVSLLLTETLAWMRRQPGTTSLRALLYMDEIFGFFPPVADPPSKRPLLSLLKQARAFGLGVVLATQNPVDLDYKGLANTGTWFIGRLQTQRDRERLLDGLTGANGQVDRARIENLLAGLEKRVFLMHSVHEEQPVLFQTRWTMSYLRGPLTREQIKQLEPPAAPTSPATPAAGASQAASATSVPHRDETAAPDPVARSASAASTPSALASARPVLPPDVPQWVLPLREAAARVATYRPALLAAGSVRFAEAKLGIDVTREYVVLTPLAEGATALRWEEAAPSPCGLDDLETEAVSGSRFAALPAAAAKAKNYPAWQKEFARWLANQSVEILRSPRSRFVSTSDEAERDFRIRLRDAARVRRDEALAELRRRYAGQAAALEEKLRRARDRLSREESQASQQTVQAALSIGATLLGAVLGRRIGTTAVGRAASSARGVGRAWKEREDVGRVGEDVAALEREKADLEAHLNAEMAKAEVGDGNEEALERVVIKPKRGAVDVRLVALAWVPVQEQA